MEDGIIAERNLPDGRILHVVPLTYGRARLCVGPADSMCYEDGW